VLATCSGSSTMQATGRRRIGTTGYRGRIAGVTARGLVVEFGLQPSCLCGSRVPAVVSQAYRRDGLSRSYRRRNGARSCRRRGSTVPASLAYSRRSCGSRVPAVVSQAYRRGACRRVRLAAVVSNRIRIRVRVRVHRRSSSSSSSYHFDGDAVRT